MERPTFPVVAHLAVPLDPASRKATDRCWRLIIKQGPLGEHRLLHGLFAEELEKAQAAAAESLGHRVGWDPVGTQGRCWRAVAVRGCKQCKADQLPAPMFEVVGEWKGGK